MRGRLGSERDATARRDESHLSPSHLPLVPPLHTASAAGFATRAGGSTLVAFVLFCRRLPSDRDVASWRCDRSVREGFRFLCPLQISRRFFPGENVHLWLAVSVFSSNPLPLIQATAFCASTPDDPLPLFGRFGSRDTQTSPSLPAPIRSIVPTTKHAPVAHLTARHLGRRTHP